MNRRYAHKTVFVPEDTIFLPELTHQLKEAVASFGQVLTGVERDSDAHYRNLLGECILSDAAFDRFTMGTELNIEDRRQAVTCPWPSAEERELLDCCHKQHHLIEVVFRPLSICVRENHVSNDLIGKFYQVQIAQHELVADCLDRLSAYEDAREMRDLGDVLKNEATIFSLPRPRRLSHIPSSMPAVQG